MRGDVRIWQTLALLLCVSFTRGASATTSEPPVTPAPDPAPCLTAAATGDDDKIITLCGLLIDSERTSRPDRLKALVARAGVHARKDQADRAIADYTAALRLDQSQAALFNARGELWRKKGDRPRAVMDFGTAIKLDPQSEIARANHKALAQEIERMGVEPVKGQPRRP